MKGGRDLNFKIHGGQDRPIMQKIQPPPYISAGSFLTSHLDINTEIMERAAHSAEALKKQIVETESQLARLKARLASLEAVNALENIKLEDKSNDVTHENEGEKGGVDEKEGDKKWPLSAEEYKRYGRQMIVPNVGLQGTASHFPPF